MTPTEPYAEVLRLRPKEGAEPRLLEIREALVDVYVDGYPDFVSATLVRPDDSDVWVDVWLWTTKAAAEDALAKSPDVPLFVEWTTLVDVVGWEWATVLSDRRADRS